MLDKVRRMFGDKKSSNIIVRKASENPFVFGWTNDSLTQQSCPRAEIRQLFGVLTAQPGNIRLSGSAGASSNQASPRLKMILGPKVFVKSVSVDMLGTCLHGGSGGTGRTFVAPPRSGHKLNFFLFPFCENSLICLEGKSMTPHRGNTILFRSSQQLPRLRLGPSTCLVRCFRNYRDTRTLSGPPPGC